ncbi:MAG: PilZ domain-containing protein [Magnetococcus sp. YQC-3]
MDEKRKKFIEMVSNIKGEHDAICGLLDDIYTSTHEEALKKIPALKKALINHSFDEDFVLVPYVRNRYISRRSVSNLSAYDICEINEGRDDIVELINNIEGHHSSTEMVVAMLSECMQSSREDFWESFHALREFLKKRFEFEDTIFGRRVSPRFDIDIKVDFEIKGNTLPGTTINISQTGCLFMVSCHATNISIDERGLLRIVVHDKNVHIYCAVKRLDDGHIYVQFLDNCPISLMENIILTHMGNRKMRV